MNHQERRHHVAVASNTANRRRPFSISQLNGLWFSNPIGACNHHPRPYHAHHEARLVEVVEVAVEDAVFRTHIGHQLEPWLNNCRIFAKTSLVVVDAIKTRLYFWTSCNKAVWPVLSDVSRTAFLKQKIGHITHIDNPGRKPSGILIEYVLDNHLLFYLCQIRTGVIAVGFRGLALHSPADRSSRYVVDLCSATDGQTRC